jgi:uncharacterized protein (TIGR04255 family)
MKIQEYVRVRYDKNPIAEVICQARFPAVAQFSECLPDELRSKLASLGYTKESKEQKFSISMTFGGGAQNQPALSNIFHFDSEKTPHRVSICPEFVALTCAKYWSWDEFRPLFIKAYAAVDGYLGDNTLVRLGLRYKDLIEREPLGLDGVPWSELIAPFLLGPLAAHSLSDQQDSSDELVSTFVSQATIPLDDCMLLLQSSLLRSMDSERTAFLIDSDFFIEASDGSRLSGEREKISEALTSLHTHAGSLFRRGITEKLHNALGPQAI